MDNSNEVVIVDSNVPSAWLHIALSDEQLKQLAGYIAEALKKGDK